MCSITQKQSFSVESCQMIDDAIEKVYEQHSLVSELIEKSSKDPETAELYQEKLKSDTNDLVEALRTLRCEILNNEVSRSDFSQLEEWLNAILRSLKRFFGYP